MTHDLLCDTLRLHEQTEDRQTKTGRIFQAGVMYILSGPAYELPADLCVMALFGGFLTTPKKEDAQ